MRRFIKQALARVIEALGTMSRIVTGQPPGLGPMPFSVWLRGAPADKAVARPHHREPRR